MTIKQTAASIAAITLLAGAPALALADTNAPAAPIAVSNVQIQEDGGYLNQLMPGLVTVSFKNTRPVAATEVDFELDANGVWLDRITDVGTFKQGATVDHSFTNYSPATNATLTVAEVKFADGSVWLNDENAAPHALRQEASIDAAAGL
jgi:hypothetical protein